MSFDTQQYIELFFQDTEEHLQLMTDALLDLEKNPADAEALSALFRSAHSIKSSSAMVGFMHISEFTHHMEDLIGHLRDNKVSIDTETVNLLFNAFDTLKEMMSQLQDTASEEKRNHTKQRAKTLTNEFTALIHKEEVEEEAPEAAPPPRVHLNAELRIQVEEARLSGERIYEIVVRFYPDAQMPATRAFLILNRLSEHGSIITTEPSLDDDQESFGSTFALLCSSRLDGDHIRRDCDVSDVESIEVREVTDSDQFEWQTPQAADASEKPAHSDQAVDAASGAETGETKVDPLTSFDRREDRQKNQTVRVSIDKLDRLLNLAAELVIQRGRSYELCQRLVAQSGKGGVEEELFDAVTQQGMFLTQLQETIMESRMVPMSMVFTRFRRVVRDLAQGRGKKVNLVIEGEDTELDKKIIDQIGDPIMHMVRNSVDHGVESPEERKAAGKPSEGLLYLNAEHQGNNIVVTIKDDGKGLDAEKLKKKAIEKGVITREEAAALTDKESWHLIFKPGFSTAEIVTDISGRGVGMDVVRRSIEQLGGSVDIESAIGVGTTFHLKLPLTLAIIQALLVESGRETYALPISHIAETIRITNSDIFSVKGQGKVIRLRDQVVPILNLRQVVQLQDAEPESDRHYVAVVRIGSQYAGLIVDRMVNEQEIVIKSLGGDLSQAPYIAGAAILGNGQVILILDTAALIEKSLGTAA